MSEKDDVIRDAREAYERCKSAEEHNRQAALEDIIFARKGEQWPADIRAQRIREGRPCLTINKLPVFIRQVVNDSRQNKPSIKVRPADDKADPKTAEVIGGLIRNIEYVSNADVAYDTAVESAVSGGFGYWRVVLDHATDDSLDLDILIRRVANPFSVYGDPNSTEADSSDWNVAFVVDRLAKAQYERQYKGNATVNWDDSAWKGLIGTDWRDESSVLVAEHWMREEVERPIVLLQDGTVLDRQALETDPDLQVLLEAGALQIHGERMARSFKVRQRIMSGLEVLEENDWLGRYIPIVPVYGDEFDIEGRRYFRSLIHSATDAQRMFNYWRTASTELVALAPKVPFIGPKGAFDHDQERWQTANTRSHAYLEYEGPVPPQRQPLDMGVAAGALQEALNASDDMKAIIGMYDASLGARSNEVSGRAILARQREGDVSTFHFIDNLARAIRHTGRILIDLIPKVYDKPRIVRVLGEDGSERTVPVNQQMPQMNAQTGQPMVDPNGAPILAIHDLAAGKYDLTVETGPSFTTRREEAAEQMVEFIRAFPPAASVIGDLLAKNLDWPGAAEIAERLKSLLPPGLQQQQQQGLPPQIAQQMEQGKQMIQQGQQLIQQLQAENAQLKQQQANKAQEMAIKQFEAETDRMKVAAEINKEQTGRAFPPQEENMPAVTSGRAPGANASNRA
ncbi:portal protein [Mesorhizobium sp. BAC0120]|uniref:portal protein n=1 Tax=Mesorhizobium sp. BAC0120 TaxID=3090670 RepID=UPI00298D0624|nr:portal protein [Mesorhizobium sp. BAC0120]MDW6020247.1 portal protein [Mesorhizobium sp. BAC0120]